MYYPRRYYPRRFPLLLVILPLALFGLFSWGVVAGKVSHVAPNVENDWIAFDEPGPSTICASPDGVTQICHTYIGPVMTDLRGVARRPVVMVIEYVYGREKVGSSVCLATPEATGAGFVSSESGPFSTVSWEGWLKYRQWLGPVSGKTWGQIQSEKDIKLDLTSVEAGEEAKNPPQKFD